MKTSQTLAIAALSGLLAGAVVACGSSDTPDPAPEAPAAQADAEKPEAEMAKADAEQPAAIPEHGCKGMNECKGQGGCHVEGANDCAGGNECKGKGGCCTMKDKSECPEEGAMDAGDAGDAEPTEEAKTEAKGDAPATTSTAKSAEPVSGGTSTRKGGDTEAAPTATVGGGSSRKGGEATAPAGEVGGTSRRK